MKKINTATIKNSLFALMTSVSLGCAQPSAFSDVPLQRYDPHIEYSRIDQENGFTLNLLYQRFQFIPESDAVALACKQAATTLTHDLADLEGREIKPINHDRIRLSLGRNGVTGITSCSITLVAEYK